MRRLLLSVLSVLALLAAPVATAAERPADPQDPTGLIASDNIELLTTLPNPGVIGARFREGLMYSTSLLGVQVYDIADAANPVQLGSLSLPHFQNEDVDLGGDILLVSNDAAESTGILYVVDISDPSAPSLRSQLEMGGNPLFGGPGHTASCLYDCQIAIVSDSGGFSVVDLRDPDNPVHVRKLGTPAANGLGVVHDMQTDADGNMWLVGYGGTAGYAVPDTAEAYLAMVTDAANPRLGDLITYSGDKSISRYAEHFGTADTEYNDFIHHNSHRVEGTGTVFVTEEDYTRPGCRGAGAFQVWETPTEVDEDGEVQLVAGPDVEMELAGAWVTELLADAAQPSVHCSAHYFDVRPGDHLVAHGWYQQGTRLLDASDPTDIRQVGYFIPSSALAWGAYWAPTAPDGDILYVADASHGIDVLRVHADEDSPEVTAPIRPEWRTGTSTTAFSAAWGGACQIILPGAIDPAAFAAAGADPSDLPVATQAAERTPAVGLLG